MIRPPEHVRKFTPAKQRFLKPAIANFFKRELPKLFGPQLREMLADEIVDLISKVMPEKEHVKPGQIVWNAIDVKTRADSPNRRFVPVILTLVDENDVDQLANGTKMPAIAGEAIARMTREAYQQGALLSMRDIGLFTWRLGTDISKKRKAYEEQHNTSLPHVGNLHDVGTCVTHKTTIIRKVVIEKKDPLKVASETNHTLRAVENYVKDFRRVEACYKENQEIDFISKATGIAKHVVKQYIKIINNIQNSP